MIISNKKGEFTKKSNIGIYDQIVCLECERMFQEYDRYAKNFLLGYDGVKQEIRDGEEKLAYIVPEYDYHNLKMFILSVLWRASVSMQPFFEKIKLGPYENEIKELIIKNDYVSEDVFPIVITRFKESNIGTNSFLDPHITREIDGVNMYKFYFGAGYKVYIKVDKRPMPSSINTVILRPNKSLCIINQDFNNSAELKLMKNLLLYNSKLKVNI